MNYVGDIFYVIDVGCVIDYKRMKMEFRRKRKAAGEEIKGGKGVGEPR